LTSRRLAFWWVLVACGASAADQPSTEGLTLEEAINRALAANRSLAAAQDQVESVRFSLASAGAEFEVKVFPGVDAGVSSFQESFGAGVSLQKKFAIGTEAAVEPRIGKIGSAYNSIVTTSLTQPLLRGVKREFNLSGVHGAEFADRSAKRSHHLARVDTVIETVTAVYEVVRQRELVSLNEESERRLEEHATAARAKEKVGLSSPIDTYRATIELKQAQDDLTTAREALGDARDDLKLILALPLEEDIQVDAPIAYDAVKMTEDEAVAASLRNRVELEQAADRVEEAERQSRVAKHNTLPDLDLVVDYSRFGLGDSLGQSTSQGVETWGIGLRSRTDAARTVERAAYGQSLVATRSARRSNDLQRDQVVRQVKRELRNLDRSEQRILIQRDKREQAKRQLALARVKFQHGLATNFDLIDAETELRRAQVSLVSTRIDYVLGTYRLRGAMGTLLREPDEF